MSTLLLDMGIIGTRRSKMLTLNSPQGRDQMAAAFMSKYGVDMKKGQNLTSGYLDAVMSK